MDIINICFLDEYSINNVNVSALSELGHYTGWSDTPQDKVIERSLDADVLIVNKVRITADIMRALPRLKLICVAATGMNNIDLDAAREFGIAVKNAVNYSTESVAEATFAAALALIRQTAYYDDYVKSGDYALADRTFHFGRGVSQIQNKRWGIIGLGNIGRRVAGIASAFGAEVVCYSPSEAKYDTDYMQLELQELLRTSDIISIHTPLNEHTKNLIGQAELELMKPSALMINVARGGIVDETALAAALDDGIIAGAALDVFSQEPIQSDNPLLKIKNPYKLVLSPHNAWASEEAIKKLIECTASNIKEFYGI